MARKKKHKRPLVAPEQGWEGFARWERCEDCELRDAITITGKPRRDYDPHRRRLRRRLRVLLFRAPRSVVDDCENCHGVGYVRRSKSGDQMVQNK